MQSKPSKGLNSLQTENQLSEMSQSLTHWEWVMLLSNAWHIFRSTFGWSSRMLYWTGVLLHSIEKDLASFKMHLTDCHVLSHFSLFLIFIDQVSATFALKSQEHMKPQQLNFGYAKTDIHMPIFYMYILCSHIYIHIHI